MYQGVPYKEVPLYQHPPEKRIIKRELASERRRCCWSEGRVNELYRNGRRKMSGEQELQGARADRKGEIGANEAGDHQKGQGGNQGQYYEEKGSLSSADLKFQ